LKFWCFYCHASSPKIAPKAESESVFVPLLKAFNLNLKLLVELLLSCNILID